MTGTMHGDSPDMSEEIRMPSSRTLVAIVSLSRRIFERGLFMGIIGTDGTESLFGEFEEFG
jgi:hypothetical protein